MKKNVWLGVFVILVLQAACSYANQQVETFAQFEQEPDSIERVITLRGTLSHGSYTPITITQPGVYRLAGAMSVTGDLAAIRIAANNVFLDLDGNTVTVAGNAGGIFIDGQDVKVINGTIAGSGSTGCGVQVQGNNCRLEHIDVVSTATGFECIHAGSNMLLDCRALQSSAAGFSFVSSGTNTVSRCQALNLAGSNSVYGFLIADGQANVFDSCVVSDAKTSALTSTAQVGGFVFQGASSFNKLSNGKVTNVSTSNSAVACYGIFCDLVLSTSNSITNNRVNGVTNTATGVGISIDSSKNYVAQNTSCNNDINFENIAPSYITSQANARGVYNINCSSDVPDTVELINSTIDTTVVPELWSIESKAEVISSKIDRLSNDTEELWSIESKAEVISSKIDTIPGQLTPELWSIESKAEVISSKIDTVPGAITPELWSIESKAEVISSKIDKLSNDTEELWSIESKAEVISSKIDTIPGQLTPELWSIESKAEVISSKIDTVPDQLTPELWSIESKAEVISSKIDRLSNDTEELWSIESKAEVISSKIDTVPGAIAPELWSIESKAEVISSKIDTIPGQLTPELWSIESKAEVISSKIDRLSNDTPELWSIESKAEVISSKIDRLSNGTEELWSIESKAEVISSKIDTVPGQLTPELWSIESKAEVISSKIDALPRDAAELWSIESKSEVISSKIDTVPGAITPELWSIESKAEVISSKIDTVPGKLTPELWSIESKSEVISSKIDKVVPAITPELWSIESKAEIISSKIDRVVPAITPELWSIESKVEVISSKLECSSTAITSVPYSITQSGAYCIASTLGVAPGSTAITISTNNVWIDFNGQALQGNIVISGGLTNIRLTNGALAGGITCSGDVTSLTMRDFGITDASNEAIRIDGIARKFVVQDCIFTDYGTTGIYINTANMLELRNSLFSDNNYSGTGLVVIQGRNVDVRECNFKQNNYGIYLGTSATGSQLKGVQIEGCLITSSSLVGISLNNCASVDIDDCEITRQIDNYKGGSGVLINGGNTIEVNDSTISQFYYGIAVRGTATAPVAAFTIRDCRVNYNMRGILCSTNTVGSVTGCILEYNGRSQAAGCGFQDLTGLNSQVWYLSNLAMGNGSSPAKQTTPFDSNYTSGYDVPANPLGMTPVLSYASAGNSTAPYYQLIKVAGGGGGSDAPAGKRGAIAHWDNVSGAFSTIDAPV